MDCARCSRANRAGARFCGGCGSPLGTRCPACGAETELDAQFCDACGAAQVAVAPAESGVARKVVTILFADLVGSTSLQERLDAESTRRVMERYYAAMRGPVEAHGGTVVQLLGDGVLCAFGVPHVAEDDAIRAVRAAVGMQQAFREFAREEGAIVGDLGLRVALNTGEVVVSDERPAGIGDPLNVAGRLQQEAREGDVLVGEATRRLVGEQVTLAHFGTFALKGRAEPVPAYRVVSLERPAGAPAIAFVGREDELRRLTSVYDAAVAAPGARLAAILGSPGLGKSRLLAEFARRLGGRALVLTAGCDAAGGATFAPLADALHTFLELDTGADIDAMRAAIEAVVPADEPERGRIAKGVAALVAGTPASPEETFFVVRRLLAALALAQPVVFALDDVQWAEPLLLDLTEHLVQWSSGVPLLVLVAARPELRDTRSSLAAPGGLVTDVVTLGGLDAGAATRLAASVIGADELPAAIAGRVLATSEGNPLFVGELVRMLVHDGALKREGDRWTTSIALADLEMPPTIQALLAARIERLRPEERTVLERASIVGRQFSRAAVAQLLPRELTDLDARLESLRRSELIEPDSGWFIGEPALRFHHALIRDAAYRRVLRGTRAELHGRFADWIAARIGDAVEHDETIGWHLEQAHQQLRELGPIDARGRALGERAAKVLAAAGRRALARDDVPVAANLLGRALDRLDATDPARADLALDWCEALLSAGDVGTAARAVAELARFTGGSDRLRAWHACFAGQLAVLTDPQSLHATADAVAAAAEALASAGDTGGEAKAHSVHALALMRLGKVGACEAALDRALASARRAHDRRRANAVLAGAPLAALWGPSPVTRASGRCLDVVRVLRITQGAPAVEAVALRCQAVLEALRGRADAARRMIASSRRMVEELGLTQQLLETDVFAGHIDLLEGDAAAAERSLRRAYDGLRDQGLGIDAARAAALLARALLAQGRAAEAEALSRESESLAGDDLQAAIAWRGVRAEAVATRGEHALAVDFARAAVEIAAATDALLHHADARSALATALRAAGRGAEADSEERRAIELWEAKGATLLVERTRRGVTPVAPAAPPRREPAVPARSVHRRLRANAATAYVTRFDASVAARDVDALSSHFADDMVTVHHPTMTEFGREASLSRFQALLRAEGLAFGREPLATLGDSLALCHASMSLTALGEDDIAPFGAIDTDTIVLVEVDAHGRQRRAEVFAHSRLGDAIARFFARHAEILPDGPERVRAAATARSFAAIIGPLELDRYATALASAVEFVDHRALGMGSARGAEALLRGLRSLLEVTGDTATRFDDILDLRSDALLVRRTNFGTERVGGGAYERHSFALWVFGADGLMTRLEQFDADREAEALARFDELMAPRKAVARRVRPNAATENVARLGAAVAARDADAFLPFVADDLEYVHHPTGTTYDRSGAIARLRSAIRAEGTVSHELLATLGDSLALCRQSAAASGEPGRHFDVGAYEIETLDLIEVDEQGRRRRLESFAENRLGGGLARLYERYAELFPDGAARERAAATARSVATVLGSLERRSWATALAPAVEFVDHRPLGLGPSHDAAAFLRGLSALHELAADVAVRDDDVLDLRSDLLLVRRTNSGTDRASGGAFERRFLSLWIFGSDGLVTRVEWFASDREADALARIDELTAESPAKPKRRVRANAATANVARLDAAMAARDVEALPGLLSDGAEAFHHPSGVTYDRAGALSTWTSLLAAQSLGFQHEWLATLGDSLALCRRSVSFGALARGRIDVGALEIEEISLSEVDARGRRTRAEFFAIDHLGDAIARLYERYAELLPDGPARERAAATARSAATLVPAGASDSNRLRTAVAADLEHVDQRTLGLGSRRGFEAFLRGVDALRQLSNDFILRIDDILDLRSDVCLMRVTTLGTDRASGGAFERPFLLLLAFGSDGLVSRWEQLDADRDAEALARFDALSAVPAKPERRVRPNAATAHAAQIDETIAAGDADGLAALFTGESEALDHTTGTTWDRHGLLATWRSLLRARDPMCRHEPLATLGDSLALCRISTSARGSAGGKLDVGDYEIETTTLVEVDAQGRRQRLEIFARDRLGDAIARLYERYAELLPEGPARERAAAVARSTLAMFEAPNLDRLATAFAPAIELVDKRSLGTWSARGAEAALQHFRSLLEVAGDIAMRECEILCLQSDALLVRRTHCGIDRASGGSYERRFILLMAFGTDGRLTRIEWFDADREAEALARFDELAGESRSERFSNTASRTMERFERCWRERDWDGVVATFVPTHRMDDRRRLMRMEISGEEFLANERMLFDETASQWHGELLATRGERLALLRMRFTAEVDGSGPMAVEMLDLVEVDSAGRRASLVVFDLDGLEAAYAELDRRYASGEGAPWAELIAHSRAVGLAAANGDRAALARLLPDDFTMVSRQRLVGMGERKGRDEYIENLGVVADLGVRADLRIDHLPRISATAGVAAVTWYGVRDGGAFESSLSIVTTHDGRRFRSWEVFDLDQLDAALARYDELTAKRVTPRIENLATRTSARVVEFQKAQDWERFTALFRPDFRNSDRRRMFLLELDRDQYLESLRTLFAMTRQTQDVLATRGNRLAMVRVRWTGSDASVGPSEGEFILVAEVDDAGSIAALILFDLDSLDAAYAELDDRYAGGEAALCADTWEELRRRLQTQASHDWLQLASLLPADLVTQDHRPLRWGTLRSRDEYLAMIRGLADLAPDVTLRLEHVLGLDRRAGFSVARWVGSREGGAFEIPVVHVSELGPDKRLRVLHAFDLEQLDEARACYEALLRPSPAPRIENAATRTIERFQQAWAARDREGAAATLAPGFRQIDRRTMMHLDLDRDEFLTFMRGIFDMSSSRLESEILATRGDRLALARLMFKGADHSIGPTEIESLAVIEADEHGNRLAMIRFDAGDRDAAYVELDDRYAAGDPDYARMNGFGAGMADRDWDAVAAFLASNFVMHDHRPLGWETLHGPRAWIDMLRSLVELAPDARLRVDHLTHAARGSFIISTWLGTRDGGAFEDQKVVVSELDERGCFRRMDQYNLEQLDEALARFAELRPDPLRIPTNTAARVSEGIPQAFEAADWAALASLCAPTMVWDDRRRLSLVTGGRDMFMANIRVMLSHGARLERTLLATAGDRLALHRLRWTGTTADIGGFENENLSLIEVDGEGRITAIVAFDADDRRAASLELHERFARSDSAPWLMSAEFLRALRNHDLEGCRTALPESFVFCDHRRAGAGRLESADEYVAFLGALFEQSSDVLIEPLYYVATERYGVLTVAHSFGTLADGGEFESVFVQLVTPAGGELFELDDLERARARFEELRPDPLRIPPNAATRASDRERAAFEARDWDTLTALHSPTLVYEDRRRSAQLAGDRDMRIGSLRFMAAQESRPQHTLLATAGDRLALFHLRWIGARDAPDLELEVLSLTEVDAEGLITATLILDPDDRAAASAELRERFARSDLGRRLPAAGFEYLRAFNDHDLARLRAVLPDDFVFHDHRHTGVGRLATAADYVASMPPLLEAAPGVRLEILCYLAAEDHGDLAIARMFGTLAEGGAFETVAARLSLYHGERLTAIELFEPEDLDLARARLAELRPEPRNRV